MGSLWMDRVAQEGTIRVPSSPAIPCSCALDYRVVVPVFVKKWPNIHYIAQKMSCVSALHSEKTRTKRNERGRWKTQGISQLSYFLYLDLLLIPILLICT